MQEPITLKELDDLIIQLTDLRSSGKLTLAEVEAINDAIIVAEIQRGLIRFGITKIEVSNL